VEKPLVSIIIPTYNRANLIGETLDSVIAQTYTNWECNVVDDGSMDNTDEVMAAYVAKDSRFRYFHRPDTHKPGGSGARNYGFLQSTGAYIQWFDSDDLMVPEKIEIKVKAIVDKKVDLLISKGKYFNLDDRKNYKYDYKEEDINLLSYTTQGITWYTSDMMMRRSIAERIQFNEELKSGQEGNYSYKILLETNLIGKVDEVLTMRRYHENSIGVARRKDRKLHLETTFISNWITLNELREKYKLPKEFEKYVFVRGVRLYFDHKNIKLEPKFHALLKEIMGKKSIYFYLGDLTNRLFGKYHFFYSKMK